MECECCVKLKSFHTWQWPLVCAQAGMRRRAWTEFQNACVHVTNQTTSHRTSSVADYLKWSSKNTTWTILNVLSWVKNCNLSILGPKGWWGMEVRVKDCGVWWTLWMIGICHKGQRLVLCTWEDNLAKDGCFELYFPSLLLKCTFLICKVLEMWRLAIYKV